ncbi:sulfate permease-like protein [Dendryphion nanum]|uniref:Sulfate permease-like protein n=1 Tax=Dendryphion nanum TaxID=256645 RepID=A0A9P9IB78_9PLEO|nr:sulfate permease-like protein [Dendryphion nanum]
MQPDLEDRIKWKVLSANVAKEVIGDTYQEDDPSVIEWLRSHMAPTSEGATSYIRTLFPSAQWLRRYNICWFQADMIAGITVGLVVVPQGMAYALLAQLSPAFGLYTSFTGACLYWVFGTSKDIVIGTTAVGSLLVGNLITKIEGNRPGQYTPKDIAHTLSFLAGAILLLFGILRLGWIIEFIPYISISAFVTGASITIISTQLPTVLGITGINTREAPYKIYVNTLKGLPRMKLDAAIGIVSIVLLTSIRYTCVQMERCQPHRKRVWSLVSSMRLAFTILLFTFMSWLVNRQVPVGKEKFRIVGHIDKGFTHAGIPRMKTELFKLVLPELPAVIVVLVVEHIAIAKSFGRIFDYSVISSQEMLAQGAANILSPFVGGYVCTGSFGASAVLSKAGARTPLAGLFSAMVLVLALYALTAVFRYIPNAALAGLIIHSVLDLITPPKSLLNYWRLSPVELGIWVCGVAVALFSDLQIAIYVTVGQSLAILLIRMAMAPGRFYGSTKAARIIRNGGEPYMSTTSSRQREDIIPNASTPRGHLEKCRPIFLPYDRSDNHNPAIAIEPVYPGVFIYRFNELFNYINQASHIDYITSYITSRTRRNQPDPATHAGGILWCHAPHSAKLIEKKSCLPLLRAVILDLSAVNAIDITTIQGLTGLRNLLDKHAAPAMVEWHFSGVHNRWTRKALSVAGFGSPVEADVVNVESFRSAYIFMASPKIIEESGRVLADNGDESGDIESLSRSNTNSGKGARRHYSVFGVDRPFFHEDLRDAVEAAVSNSKTRTERENMASLRSGICE